MTKNSERKLVLQRTTSDNEDFQTLVTMLDEDLAVRDGDEHAFYASFNKIAQLRNVVVGYWQSDAVCCGAFKQYEPKTVEIKRMFVSPALRGKRFAAQVLAELELWAKETGNVTCVLETGKKQPEAIGLYLNNGYRIISNYGQYKNIDNSVCMKKHIG